MANCLKCGTQLPAFSVGDYSPLCRNCRAQEQVALAAPEPAQPPVAQEETPAPKAGPWDDMPQASPAAAGLASWLTGTRILVGVNVLVFGLVVGSGVSFLLPDGGQLVRWGSDFGPATLSGQYWRSVTSAFLHFGIIHLLLNMWCLLALGMLLDRLFGRLATIAVYLLTAVGASLLSLAWEVGRNSAGASGAVFGFAGVLISFFYFARLNLPKERVRRILGWVVRFAVINLIIGLSWRINNMAHLGGLLTGLLIGFFFARSFHPPFADVFSTQREGARWRALLGTAALLVVLFAVLVKARAPLIEFYQGQTAMQSGNYNAAIVHFNKAIAMNPNDALTHGALGYALAGMERYDDAIREYRRALEIEPGMSWVEVNMAASYLATGHADTAVSLFRKNTNRTQWEAEDFRYFGEALMEIGELNEAVRALQRSIQLDPKDARPHRLLAQAYHKMGRHDDAIREEAASRSLRSQAVP